MVKMLSMLILSPMMSISSAWNPSTFQSKFDESVMSDMDQLKIHEPELLSPMPIMLAAPPTMLSMALACLARKSSAAWAISAVALAMLSGGGS